MQPRKRQFLLKLEDPLCQNIVLSFQRSNFGSICGQQCHQIFNAGRAHFDSFHS
ncbi:hypothetical protein [Brucella intermedia]|uniref:hypothetical protein n=1 Tax=Brucella intermedia TaxID=94625 RepID=UPI00235E227E|nr:hypothetical protein [Brucella intermedia]